MIHRAPDEFSLSASPTSEVDAQEAFGRVFSGDAAVLRDRAMLLISGLLRNDEGSPVIKGGDNRVTVKVISELSSVRVEIRDSGSGVVLGGLRRPRGPTSRESSPHLLSNVADRWGWSPVRRAHGSGSSWTSRREPVDNPEIRFA